MKPTKPAAAPSAAPESKAAQMVAKGKVTADLSVIPAPATSVIPWADSGSTGFENVKSEDLGVPFLVICQKGSPEFDETNPQFVNKKILGIKPGAIFNTVTREIVWMPGAEPLTVVPVFWDKYFVEWRPRTTAGGGIVRAHKDPSLVATCRRDEKNHDILPNGNILVTTAYFYLALMLDEVNYKQLVIGMSSTQLRKSRLWLNMAQALRLKLPDGRTITPPLYSHSYRLSTQPESNDKGSWFGWKIEVDEMIENVDLATDLVELHSKLRTSAVPDVTAAHSADEELV